MQKEGRDGEDISHRIRVRDRIFVLYPARCALQNKLREWNSNETIGSHGVIPPIQIYDHSYLEHASKSLLA
jgi:hypothetical protein